MQYRKRNIYTTFFTSFLITTIVLEICAIFFLPYHNVLAAQAAIRECPNGRCPTNGEEIKRNGAGRDCNVICTDPLGGVRLGGRLCKMDNTTAQTVCCCKKSASAAPALAPAPTSACNRLTHSEAGAGKCGDICRANNPSKWGDGSYGGGDICCCTLKGSGTTAAGGGSSTPLCSGGTCSFPPPIGPNIQAIVGGVIKAIIGIVGSLALLMFVWGGFLWLSAAGDDERIKKGSSTMIWASIGMAAIFGAYAIAKFIIEGLFQQT